MSELNLNYKATNIATAERKYGLNFFAELERMYLSAENDSEDAGQGAGLLSIVFILSAGGLSEDEVDELIDNDGIVAASRKAGEALAKSGFLAKVMSDPEVTNQLERLQKEASQTTGETKKA